MKNIVLIPGILIITAVFGRAQTVSETLTIPEMKASIANLEAHIDQRIERRDEIVEDILELDGRVEQGVDEIVELLASVADSNDSKTRVSNTKEEAIAGLKRMIEFYGKKRAAVREQLRTGKTDVPLEDLEKDVEAFDNRIEKRVEQIVDLTESFTGHEDFEKYVVTGESSGWGPWGHRTWQNEEINEDWKQNRRDVKKTRQNTDTVMEALKKSIEDLTQRKSYLGEKLKHDNLSEPERALYQSDLDRIDKIVAGRQQELNRLQSGEDKPSTHSVGRDEAYKLEQMLTDARGDLASDFYEIFRKYDELNWVRGQISTMQDNLQARKDYLAKREKGE